jgi:hypothetical protein
MARRRVVGMIILLLLTTGCGGSLDQSSRTALAAAPEPTEEVRDFILPLDDYQLSVNEIYLIETAQDILTRDCMKKQGYDWDVIENRKPYPDLRNRRRYGVIEMPVAKEMGYHTNPRLLGSTDVTARKMDRENALSAAERKAALDPAKGCYKRAEDQLARGSRVDDGLVNKLNASSLDEALKNQGTVREIRSWSHCMAEIGYAYKGLYDAAEDQRWMTSEKPSREEKRTAEADVTCKQRVGLVRVLRATETEIQKQEIRGRQEYFSLLASAKKQHLDAARAVLDRE